jgi:hypothetical protein
MNKQDEYTKIYATLYSAAYRAGYHEHKANLDPRSVDKSERYDGLANRCLIAAQDTNAALLAEIERLQERMTKMEILLEAHDPEWETAPIFTGRPTRTDKELEEIFKDYYTGRLS